MPNNPPSERALALAETMGQPGHLPGTWLPCLVATTDDIARLIDAARAEGIAIGLRMAADKVADNVRSNRAASKAAKKQGGFVGRETDRVSQFKADYAKKLETQIRAIDPAKLQEQT